MRTLLAIVLAGLCAGCSSPRRAEQIPPPPANTQPMVWVRGDVKNRAVPWNEELTLATAIVAAEYTGLWDPHSISIIRQGHAYKVNTRDLLRGRDDPALEPWDVIVIER